MEGETQMPAAASAAVSKVLDDDDLLVEIIVRVAFPTSLVRAALVCKRWLQHVSDTKFLHRFCKLHPPTLLGFYICHVASRDPLRFVPMLPQPPELSAVIRRASFSLDSGHKVMTYIKNCRNGRVFATCGEGSESIHGVYNPLFPQRGMSVIPPYPRYQRQDNSYCSLNCLLSVKEGDDLSYLNVLVDSSSRIQKSFVRVQMLRPGDGVWRTRLTLATDLISTQWDAKLVLIDSKIYILSFPSEIVVLDFMALSISTIRLPQGVENGIGDTMLSQADDASGVYLIQLKELQLGIWLHNGDRWLMVDTICLVQMFANLRMSDCMGEDEHTAVLRIKQVGDNVEFAFLQMGRSVLYLDIKCRTLRKVYEVTEEDRYSIFLIHPFKMIWPPTFPPPKAEPLRNDS